MAIQNRTTWARLKVGILAIFAMTILAVLVFLITGQTNIFEHQVMIYTYMADAAALTTGAPVNLDGIPIGKVETIRLSGSKDPMRLVRIDMELPAHTLKDIPSDSLASISAANVLGTKYINIKSGKGTTPVGPDQELPSVNTGEIQDLVQQGFGVLNSLLDTVQRVDKIVAEGNVEGRENAGGGASLRLRRWGSGGGDHDRLPHPFRLQNHGALDRVETAGIKARRLQLAKAFG